jgi:hypothetical protein
MFRADDYCMALSVAEKLTLISFLGYGNPKADVVFIGMEEGLSEPPALEQQLHERAKFTKLIDLAESAEVHAGRFFRGSRPPIQPTWNMIVRILLALEGEREPTNDDVRFYQRDRLGRTTEPGALLELFPLPSLGISTWRYSELFPEYTNRTDYLSKLLPQRVEELQQHLSYGPKLVVAYGASYWDYYKLLYPSVAQWTSHGPFEVSESGGTRIILSPHFTARTMNGRREDLIGLATAC